MGSTPINAQLSLASHIENIGAQKILQGFAFALDVLDQGQDGQSRWLLVFVNVTDMQRKADTLGALRFHSEPHSLDLTTRVR